MIRWGFDLRRWWTDFHTIIKHFVQIFLLGTGDFLHGPVIQDQQIQSGEFIE